MLPALSKATSLNKKNRQLRSPQTFSAAAPNPHLQLTKHINNMLFRIEHLIPPDAACAPSTSSGQLQYTIGGNKLLQKPTNKMNSVSSGGVRVAQLTPIDTISESLATQNLISVNIPATSTIPNSDSFSTDETQGTTSASEAHECNSRTSHTALVKDRNGLLTLTAEMMRKLKLSEDIHGHNAIFEMQNHRVRLRIVRDIAKNEEIISWFTEEIALLMGIPFLSPLNIQGNDRYICHICSIAFRTPHPLKIHLALDCGRQNIETLWLRLHCANKAHQYSQQHSHQPPLLPTVSNIEFLPQLPAINANSTITTASEVRRFSAFKPITSTGSTMSSAIPSNSISLTALSSRSDISFLPALSDLATQTLSSHMQLLSPTTSNAAAQIEAIVSNMGSSKQGHLCIYCGKVYSRKYGLKIHIRTHTGFKPLKCKYCLRPFGDPSNLNKHVRLHIQTNANNSGDGGEIPNPPAYSLAQAPNSYQCHICRKTLGKRREFTRHMQQQHPNTHSTNHDTTTRNHIATYTATSTTPAQIQSYLQPQTSTQTLNEAHQ